jgi:alkaline phosphatase
LARSVGTVTRPSEQSTSNRGNLIERAQQLGYEYVSDRTQLRRSRARKLLGLFANEEMFEQRPEGEGDIYDPVVPLDEMTSRTTPGRTSGKPRPLANVATTARACGPNVGRRAGVTPARRARSPA